jgi:hypothetical protein
MNPINRKPSHKGLNITTSSIESVTNGWRDGDGVDPREDKKRRKRSFSNTRDYPARRLAGQIRDVLDLVIPQSKHSLLCSFAVGSVEPTETGGNFVVQVYSTDPTTDYDPREIKATLDKMKPRLRAEVAKDVTRKNAPDFKFDVLPPRVQPR